MNTHDDLLNYNDDMCSLCEDDVSNMCSKDGHDTCGDRHIATKGEFVEILTFTHFARVFKFSGQRNFERKKEISHEIKVSVGFELV